MKKIKYIYRVENDQGMGPYNGTSSHFWTSESHENNPRTPDPVADDLLYKNWKRKGCPDSRHYLFGFETLDQVTKWFNQEELKKLYKLGFYITPIDVSKASVIKGDFQIIYLL